MNTRLRTIILSIVVGLAVWIVDAVLDALVFYEGSFWDLLILHVPSHELYIRLIILAVFITFGLIVSGLLAGQARAKDALGESQRPLKTLMSNLPGMAYRCRNNEKWTMTFVSAGCADLTGYPPADLIDDRMVAYGDLIVPEDRAAVWSAVQTGVESGEPYQMAYRITTADGAQKWVWEQGEAIPSLDGGEPTLEGFITDVTARMQAEEALRQSEELSRTTLYSIGDAVITTDNQGRVQQMNPVAEALTGWREAEAASRPLPEIFHIVNDETRVRVESPVERVLKIGATAGLANHTLLIARDGTEYPIADSGAPIRNAQGEITGVVLVFRDQTEERAAEQALRESEQKYRYLFENMLSGFAYHRIVLDENGQAVDYIFLDVNDAFEQQTGLVREKIIGRPVTEVIPGIEDEKWIHLYGKVVRTGKPARFELYSEVLNRWYWVSAYRLHKDEFVTIFHDITERVQAEEALRRSEARLAAFTSAMPDVGFILDGDGTYLEVLGAPDDLLAAAASKLKGSRVSDILPREAADKTLMAIRQALATGEVQSVEYSLDVPAGQRWFEGRTLPASADAVGSNSVTFVARDITKRRQAEEALRASEQRYRALAENAPTGIWQLSPDGRTIFVNPAMCSLLQVDDPEELADAHVSDFLSEEDMQKAREDVAKRRDGLPSQYEAELIGRKGQRRNVLVAGGPIQSPDGELHSLIGMFVDITERVKAEEALDASERRYRALAESAPVGIWQLDTEGHTIYVNPAMCSLLQVDGPEELADAHVSEFFSEEDYQRTQRGLAERRAGIASRYEVELIGREGRKRDILVSGAPIFSPDGELYSTMGMIIDITERKQAVEALRESEERYRDLYNSIHDAILVADMERNLVNCNPAFTDLFGYTLDEIKRLEMTSLYADARQFEAMAEALRGNMGDPNFLYMADYKTKSGRVFPGETNIFYLKDDEGNTTGFIGLIRDITERVQAEKALRESEARLAAFTGAMPDLGFILNGDGMYLEVMGARKDLLAARIARLKGRYMHDVLPQDVADQCLAAIRQTLATGEVQSVEYSLDVSAGHRQFEGRTLPMGTDIVGTDTVVFVARDITKRRQAEDAERKQRLLAEALRDTAAALHSTLELDEVLDRILEAAEELVPHSGANIILADETSGALKLAKYCPCYKVNDLTEPQMPEGADLTALNLYRDIVQTHKPMIIPDTHVHPSWPTDNPSIRWIRSYLCTPILVDGEVAGYINLDGAEADAFTPDDAEALVALAGQAAVAIDSARLYEQARQQAQYLTALNQASSRVSRWGLDLDGVLQAIVTTLTEEIGLDFARIWLADREGETLDVRASAGRYTHTGRQLAESELADRSGRLAQIAQSGKPFLTNQVQEDETFDREWTAEHGIVAFAGYPLKKDRRLMAVLTIFHTHPLSDTVLDVMGSFVNQAAIAIENARLYEELEEYSGILEQAVAERTADLERAKEQVESILHHSPDGIVLLTPNGVIETTNPAAQAMLGYSEDELSGQPTNMLIEPSYASRCDAAQENVRLENATQRVELLIRRKDGTTFDAQAVLGPMLEGNTLLGIVCSLRDITALKEIERIKDDFLATAAHELRTPLTSIRGFSELLLTRDLSRERQERYHRHINNQSTQLANIIDDLLDISRLEAGRELDLKLEPVRMSGLIREVVDPFVETMPEYTFRLDTGQDAPVMGDVFRLSQVVRNLVLNAVKYSPEGGAVAIKTRVRDTMLEVSVADQGIGITKKQRVHLFEKFYRADPSGTSGTGLGLVICKLIVEGHGGEIWVESQPGEGSTFTFTVPLAV